MLSQSTSELGTDKSYRLSPTRSVIAEQQNPLPVHVLFKVSTAEELKTWFESK
jgi:hypothetical protein